MTAAYSKHFVDVIKRHEQVQKHLVSSHVSMRGASVGISFFKLTFSVPYVKTVLSAIGRNFSSSIHVDPDVGFTFEGALMLVLGTQEMPSAFLTTGPK